MRIMFWNVRGLGNPARRRQVREHIAEEGLEGVGLQETMKTDFTHKELSELSGNNNFRWIWKEASGHSGGILVGVREDNYEVETWEVGDFYVSLGLRNRVTNLRWDLITVYGLTNHDRFIEFIAELSRKCLCATLPLVLGGDFNLVRQVNEKSTGRVDLNLMDRFNMFINLHQLQEIMRNGPKYT
jgi:exonuclease III